MGCKKWRCCKKERCCVNCDAGYRNAIKIIFTIAFYYFFLPSATLFTCMVTLMSCTEGLKRAAFMLTDSFSFDGLKGPEALVISTKEFLFGCLVSGFLTCCFFAFLYFHNKKVRKGDITDILPYESSYETLIEGMKKTSESDALYEDVELE